MGLYMALNTGGTGLGAHSTMLDVIGDNIANVNTTGFKSTRAELESNFALLLREAVPSRIILPFSRGSNPAQVGTGVKVGGISRNFRQGEITPSGVPTDMAIDGNGFFILQNENLGSLTEVYTRDGSFRIDANQQLVSRDGLLVQGWQAYANGDIDTSQTTTALTIPLGSQTLVAATTALSIDGNLNAGEAVATEGQIQMSQALIDASGTPATRSTQLTDLRDADGAPLIATGDTLRIGNISKGPLDILVEPQTFTVGTDGTTVGEMLDTLEGALGIHTAAALPAAAGGIAPGVSIDAAGQIVIASNVGAVNAVTLNSGDLLNATSGAALTVFEAPVQRATGEGVTTEFKVYDSLGEDVDVRLRMVVESADELSTTWRWYAESLNDSDVAKSLQTGTVSFDSDGRFAGQTTDALMVNLADRGASDLEMAVDFSQMTMLEDSNGRASVVRLKESDGAPLGVLEDFRIDVEGVIIGTYSNGTTRDIGQVALARFTNPTGLKLASNNNYEGTRMSGLAEIVVANEDGVGRILEKSLESSNVELVRELVGLIQAATGFSANGRVVSTADEMLQELLLIAR